MFREISIARKQEGTHEKRWYEDESADLFIWLDAANGVTRFQLAYDKPYAENVVEWKRGRGFSHMRVDDSRGAGHYPGSPVLRAGDAFPKRRVIGDFRARAAHMDPAISAFVLAKLYEFPGERWQYAIGALVVGLLVVRRLLK